VHPTTVARIRRQCVEQGVDAALERKRPDRVYGRELDGMAEARSGRRRLRAAPCRPRPLDIAVAGRRTGPPGGRRERLVRDGAADREANALTPRLKEQRLKEQWCIPPEANADFVSHMEDVLDVYARPADPARPLVCLDETSRQVPADLRAPLPAEPGRATRRDPEYAREGVVNPFPVGAPLLGRRQVRVSAQRTRIDWAHRIREVVDVHDPDTDRIVLVMDRLTAHSPAPLSAAFPPAEAKRLADKLGIHDTPKHGSWPNTAEIELSVLQRRCLDRRLHDQAAVAREVAAWVAARNATAATIDWRFTAADARIKLKRPYPAFQARRNTSAQEGQIVASTSVLQSDVEARCARPLRLVGDYRLKGAKS
jgi:hypothetical protein